MIEHYSPLLTSIKTMFGYKTTPLLGASIFSAVSIETITKYVLNGTFLGASVLLIVIVCGLTILDWLFGSAASRQQCLEARKKGDNTIEEKYKFKSIKISHTIFKFLSLYLWLLLSLAVSNYAAPISWLSPLVEGISIVPILLFGFREFISIGEGIHILYGFKPYLFELGEKIFGILQLKFLTRLKQ